MRKQVRKLRHWKQRFDKNADFVWRRQIKYAGELTQPGELIPDELQDAPTKLRRFWESGTIELAEFEDPNVATGQVEVSHENEEVEIDPPIEGVTVVKAKGSWFVVNTGEDEVKVNGQKALDALLVDLRLECTDEDEEETEQRASEEAASAAPEQPEQAEGEDDDASDDETEQPDDEDTEKSDEDFLN